LLVEGAQDDIRGTPRSLDRLSVVAPMLDEDETAEAFYGRVCSALGDTPFELILVDDGSSDRTPAILDRLAESDPRVRVLHLSRSFGHQNAITAGLDHAEGDAVVMLDGDLQDPPEVIPELLDRWRAGADVVYAVRRTRAGESRFKIASARWFYRLIAALSHLELEQNVGDFRLLDRRALDSLSSMKERTRYLRGMAVWIGFTQIAVPYERDARHAGKTKFTLRRMVRFSMDALSSFSNVPLQAASVLGFVFAFVAFLGIPLVIVARITGVFVSGVPSVLMAVLLLGGIQLIAIGVIGEYIGRIYDEVRGRPLYFVRERRNLPDADPAGEAERERISV
jgi:dolichol-phosphate mannosyltransferase